MRAMKAESPEKAMKAMKKTMKAMKAMKANKKSKPVDWYWELDTSGGLKRVFVKLAFKKGMSQALWKKTWPNADLPLEGYRINGLRWLWALST